MNVCLNMIVRNEGARIERALASVSPYINSWVITDTGSTDDTKDRIVKYFTDAGIMGEIHDAPFVDFAQARNASLDYARSRTFAYQPEMFLMMDADMELVVQDPKAFHDINELGLSYEMYQIAGAVSYTNSRLLSVAAPGHYKGVTHEYLDVASSGRIPQSTAYFKDHADGSNRLDKYKRDIRLLKKGLKDEPGNARYMYYLASSYRDAGKHAEAAKWFERRVRAGGWDEEVWQAKLGYAHALKDLGDIPGFKAGLLSAYNMRPSRAETMYDLSKYLRENGEPCAALAAAEAVEHLPRPDDILFVNDFVYRTGIKEEVAISSFYAPGKREKGRRVNDALSMQLPDWQQVCGARANQWHYVRPLIEDCPSFVSRVIPFVPPDELVPLNPSVVMHHGNIWVNVRAVNYRIDPEGRYIIKATDGTANAENPIDTRNFLLNLGLDPMRDTPLQTYECYRPGNMPVEFPLVTGFEDVRLISWGNALWSSATVRQLDKDGMCEQVFSRLEGFKPEGTADAIAKYGEGGFMHVDMKRMLPSPRITEKNWSPVIWPSSSDQMFVSRPGAVLNTLGHLVLSNDPSIRTDNLSGSSQVIQYEGTHWLGLLHSAHALLGEPYKRYYTHRFVEYTPDLQLKRLSLPFYFHDRQIEFCAGMCWNQNNDKAVISYGVRDSEARIATVDREEIEAFLEGGHRYA